MGQARKKTIDATQIINRQALTLFLVLWEMGRPALTSKDIRRYKTLDALAESPEIWDQAARMLMQSGIAIATGFGDEGQGYRMALSPLATTLLTKGALLDVGTKVLGLSSAEAIQLIATIGNAFRLHPLLFVREQ